MKCSRFFSFLEVIFFGVGYFSGKFAEIWAKILRTPKNLPAPTPMTRAPTRGAWGAMPRCGTFGEKKEYQMVFHE